MNFYQAPITRLIHTDAKSETVYAIPTVYDADGVSSGSYLQSGRAVTVFFETPGWPSAASRIELRLNTKGNSAAALTVAPNVYLTDADSYLFIRGNSVYANNSTTEIHVMYCATISGVVPSEARKALPNNCWIKPGDLFAFSGIDRATTNISSTSFGPSGTGTSAVITSVRTKGSPQDFLVEFSVPINATSVGSNIPDNNFNTYRNYELQFFNSSQGSGTSIIGLSRDQLQPKVTSSSNWTGTMSNPVNLSYPAANKAGIVPAADPSKFILTNQLGFKAGYGPHHFQTVTKNSSHQQIILEQRPDYNQGFTPYRCISLYDWTTQSADGYFVELTIHPVH